MKVLLLLATATALVAADQRESFDAGKSLPAGWETGITGTGAARWEVVAEAGAPSGSNVLKQSGEATFCWAAKTNEKIRDGFVEVKFKPVSGREDQAGGLIWRFQNARNYYVVRANALEGNVVLYKTVDGARSSLRLKGRTFGYGHDAKVPAGKWSTLRVTFRGRLFTVFLDGRRLFEVEDDTFKDAGAVGVWTKADSVTLFDDFVRGSD